ncbi:MAG: class I SAM-dependent methyltransferase [Actinomycetota bacterium]
MGESDSIALNQAMWDERAPAHPASPDYKVERYVEDPTFIGDVVAFDRPRLGEVAGLRGVHLQCHIATDTVSLSRLGATMVGLDFSAASIEEARRWTARSGDRVELVEAPVYDAVDALGGRRFDLVFTGIGALIWLPSITRWAEVVASLLEPGGRLFLREGHPVLNTLADRDDELLVIEHAYFERPEPTVWDEPGTYVETDVELQHTESHEWSHGLGELFTALLDEGLEITAFEEHQSIPWVALPGQMEPDPEHPGEWHLTERPERLPLSYTLQARKPR